MLFLSVAMRPTGSEAMINVIGFLFIIAVSVALGYVILTGIYPEVAPAICLVIYGCTAYVVPGSVDGLEGACFQNGFV